MQGVAQLMPQRCGILPCHPRRPFIHPLQKTRGCKFAATSIAATPYDNSSRYAIMHFMHPMHNRPRGLRRFASSHSAAIGHLLNCQSTICRASPTSRIRFPLPFWERVRVRAIPQPRIEPILYRCADGFIYFLKPAKIPKIWSSGPNRLNRIRRQSSF